MSCRRVDGEKMRQAKDAIKLYQSFKTKISQRGRNRKWEKTPPQLKMLLLLFTEVEDEGR